MPREKESTGCCEMIWLLFVLWKFVFGRMFVFAALEPLARIPARFVF